MKRKVTLFCIACLVVVSAAASAFACACCVDPGIYSVVTARPDTFYMGIIEEMRFAGDAELYMTEAGFDTLVGLKEIEKDQAAGKPTDLNIVDSFLNRHWNLTIKTASGRKGTLKLPLPATMVRRIVDQHDTPAGQEVVAYKEFEFRGRVSAGTGFLRSAAAGTPYSLIFQGRGNGCDNSSDYSHWRLELSGRTARYAFFGKLKK